MKPTLLYISPVVPSFTGNGVAMRSAAVLEALAHRYRVSVLTVPLYPSSTKQMPASLRQLCYDAVEIPKGQIDGSVAYERQFFDTVHVFRLASLQAAEPYLTQNRASLRHLDLDDVESKMRRRFVALHRENGEETLALENEAAARKAELLELVAFRRFERVYVCSEVDQQQLRSRCQAEVCVLPNVVRPPADTPARTPDGTWRLLFVGTLGYYANQDAVVYFCTRVLPRIRKLAACPVEVTVVGAGISARLCEVAHDARVHLDGAVPDLALVYQTADTVIVPIRAGGGTRIKILEAFAHRRPVVSSAVGAEGIDAQTEEHLLVGDTPQAFADCCLRIMADPSLRDRLVANARALVEHVYTPEALQLALACLPTIQVRQASPMPGALPASERTDDTLVR